MGNAANEAKQKRLECRRSPTKRLNLGSQTEGEWGSDNSGEGYCRFDFCRGQAYFSACLV